jgi:hypothetical protein
MANFRMADRPLKTRHLLPAFAIVARKDAFAQPINVDSELWFSKKPTCKQTHLCCQASSWR